MVRSKNTGPELKVRSLLHLLGFRFRLHRADLPGKPDIVLPKHQTVLFVHGCFFHGHSCPRAQREPKTNSDYWRRKRQRNSERDAASLSALKEAGWRPIVVWECELNNMPSLTRRLRKELGPKASPKLSIKN
ncbi:MAG: very short patch repair endonuclease [Terracidiphilus sp.]